MSVIILLAFIATQSSWAMSSDVRVSHIRAKSAGECDTTSGALANSLGVDLSTKRGQAPFSAQVAGAGGLRITLDDEDRARALALVRVAVQRTGTALLYIGANSPESVLERILESQVLSNQYKNDLFAYLNDLSDEESGAFHNFLNIAGNNTTSKLMRYGFQLSYFERSIRQRIRAILEADLEEEVPLEVLSIGVANGSELMSVAIVISDASSRAVRELAREAVKAGQNEEDALVELESRLKHIKFILRGIDIDSRQIDLAKQKFPDGYTPKDVAIAKPSVSAARWDYISKRVPNVKELIDDNAMHVVFERVNFLDADAEKYIRQADYIFVNSVLYQLSLDAQEQACRALSAAKPRAVLFIRDACIGTTFFQQILLMPQASTARDIWRRNFEVLDGNRKTNEQIWLRKSKAAAAGEILKEIVNVSLLAVRELLREKQKTIDDIKGVVLTEKGFFVSINGSNSEFSDVEGAYPVKGREIKLDEDISAVLKAHDMQAYISADTIKNSPQDIESFLENLPVVIKDFNIKIKQRKINIKRESVDISVKQGGIVIEPDIDFLIGSEEPVIIALRVKTIQEAVGAAAGIEAFKQKADEIYAAFDPNSKTSDLNSSIMDIDAEIVIATAPSLSGTFLRPEERQEIAKLGERYKKGLIAKTGAGYAQIKLYLEYLESCFKITDNFIYLEDTIEGKMTELEAIFAEYCPQFAVPLQRYAKKFAPMGRRMLNHSLLWGFHAKLVDIKNKYSPAEAETEDVMFAKVEEGCAEINAALSRHNEYYLQQNEDGFRRVAEMVKSELRQAPAQIAEAKRKRIVDSYIARIRSADTADVLASLISERAGLRLSEQEAVQVNELTASLIEFGRRADVLGYLQMLESARLTIKPDVKFTNLEKEHEKYILYKLRLRFERLSRRAVAAASGVAPAEARGAGRATVDDACRFLAEKTPALQQAVRVLNGLLEDRVITNYYITGSFARADLHVSSSDPHDIDFAVDVRLARWGNVAGELERGIKEIEDIGKRYGLAIHITTQAYGPLYRISGENIEPTGEILSLELFTPTDKELGNKLIELRTVKDMAAYDIDFFVDLYRKAAGFKTFIAAGISQPAEAQAVGAAGVPRWIMGMPFDIRLSADGFTLENMVEINLPGNRRMLIMDEHNYAFPFWWKAYKEGVIGKGCALLHIDAHYDDWIEECPNDPTRVESASFADAFKYAVEEEEYGIVDFIYPAVKNGIIDGKGFYCAGVDGGVQRRVFASSSADNYSIACAEEAISYEQFLSANAGKTKILDIDIDVLDEIFKLNKDRLSQKQLDAIVYNHLRRFCDLAQNVQVITIATSPGHTSFMGQVNAVRYAAQLACMIDESAFSDFAVADQGRQPAEARGADGTGPDLVSEPSPAAVTAGTANMQDKVALIIYNTSTYVSGFLTAQSLLLLKGFRRENIKELRIPEGKPFELSSLVKGRFSEEQFDLIINSIPDSLGRQEMKIELDQHLNAFVTSALYLQNQWEEVRKNIETTSRAAGQAV